ncbi:MAG: antiviral RADAR system adenosine triphosphatase RdrA [Plesiomonas sp.]
MDSQQQIKYIPLYASETAVLHDTNTILPRDEIYKPLAELILHARNRAKEAISNSKSLDVLREHNAISIDGDRGTGKTAVLVNLRRYLELEHKDLLADVHILNPIDPTLLEDGESLFLHIIVAAVLHDEEIKQAQRNKPEQSRALNNALNQLANSLEAVDTQKVRHGIDKVRAMYGNKQLADCVHDFFYVATQLLGKKILILPIDDVDTSLNLAFENLEIIRRYLTTPYVLPIVSGDRDLYKEVTWRDFHGRLIKDSTYCQQEAYATAIDLAKEYQRKVLPFPRRLIMPEVSRYWQWDYDRDYSDRNHSDKKGVMLGDPINGMPLSNFISWLEIYLAGPVNGQENSRLPLPIPSIRALTQLVNYCSDFIPNLPNAIREARSELEVRRVWQMQPSNIKVRNNYNKNMTGASDKDTNLQFYSWSSTESIKDSYSNSYQLELDKLAQHNLPKKLANYFRFEPAAGPIYLVLLAKQHWLRLTTSRHPSSIFDTPLFQPLEQNTDKFSLFDKPYDLTAWASKLVNRLPDEWLAGLKSHQTMLPYPEAEVGINSSKHWDYVKEISQIKLPELNEDRKHKSIFLINLLTQSNFYTNAKQSMLLNVGRIFELIIASIVMPISSDYIYNIINQAPFFSTAALAPTKTLQLEDDNIKSINVEQEKNSQAREEEPQDALITQLQNDINKWREAHNINQANISPWLVYKVFNKVYSQVSSSDILPNGMTHLGTAINKVAHIFYATWFAFGSFEKGELFGLRNVVATSNTNSENLKNVESNESYNINVRPFLPIVSEKNSKQVDPLKDRTPFGENTHAISYFLADHPLREWIDEVIKLDWPKTEKDINSEVIKFIRNELGMTVKNIEKRTIRTAASKIPSYERMAILEKMESLFPANNYLVKTFASVCQELN